MNFKLLMIKFYNKREIKLFLTRFRYIIIFSYNMYYKSLRSRIMFEKTLWNREINQKKYFDNGLTIIYLKTKENLNQLDFESEFKFIDKKKKKEFFKNEINLEFFKNFKGCIFLCDFFFNENNEEQYGTLIFFYNILTLDVLCFSLKSKIEKLVIYNIIDLYLEDDYKFIELRNIIYLLDNFVDQINSNNKIFIDKETKGFFLQNYNNKKSFLLYFKDY